MSKRRYLILDLVRSEQLGLNPTESILASALYGLLSQSPIQYDGSPYHMADYDFIKKYCPILPEKTDTLRRLYKRLENIGLIQVIKIDKHVFFTPSQTLRDWGLSCESDDAEKNPQSTEKNPQSTEKNPQSTEKNPQSTGKNPQSTEKNPQSTEKNPKKAEKNPLTPYINNIILLEDNYNKENSLKESSATSCETLPKNNQEDYNFEDGFFDTGKSAYSINTPIEKKEKSSAKKEKRAIPESFEEVEDYCREKGYNINVARFYNFYSSNGWKVGKNPMKDWRAAVRYWSANDENIYKTNTKNYEQRTKNQPPSPDELARAVAEGIARAHTRQEWE